MAHPEGTQGASADEAAAKFSAPVIAPHRYAGCLSGLGAEEASQSEALARSILEMAALPTPCIAVVLGREALARALALGVADRGADAGKLGVLGHLTGSWRRHSVEGRVKRSAPPTPSNSLPRPLWRLKLIDDIIPSPWRGAFGSDATGEALREALHRAT